LSQVHMYIFIFLICGYFFYQIYIHQFFFFFKKVNPLILCPVQKLF